MDRMVSWLAMWDKTWRFAESDTSRPRRSLCTQSTEAFSGQAPPYIPSAMYNAMQAGRWPPFGSVWEALQEQRQVEEMQTPHALHAELPVSSRRADPAKVEESSDVTGKIDKTMADVGDHCEHGRETGSRVSPAVTFLAAALGAISGVALSSRDHDGAVENHPEKSAQSASCAKRPPFCFLADAGATRLQGAAYECEHPWWQSVAELCIPEECRANIWFTITANAVAVTKQTLADAVQENSEHAGLRLVPWEMSVLFRIVDQEGQKLCSSEIDYASYVPSAWCATQTVGGSSKLCFPLAFQSVCRLAPCGPLLLQGALYSTIPDAAVTLKDLQWGALLIGDSL